MLHFEVECRFDKSAIQSFSQQEIKFLYKHYDINITPVLIIEILADLKKHSDNKALPEVRQLANKLSIPIDSQINGHYKRLIAGSLLGNTVEMDGIPIVLDGIPIETSTGEKSIFVDEPPERKALRRWQNGQFTEAEQILSLRWREFTKSLDLNSLKNRFIKLHVNLPKVATFDELERLTNSIVPTPHLQSPFLKWMLKELDLGDLYNQQVIQRWDQRGFSSLKEFSPYAHYCIKVEVAFALGLIGDLIGTRSTNRVDLEYLFYLPFCNVFTSGDKLQSKLSRIFLTKDQVFLDAKRLKADLNQLATYWDNLTEGEKQENLREYGNYPPKNFSSITCQVWGKFMRPWQPGFSNRAINMTKEEEKKLLDSLRPMFEAIDKVKS